MCNDQATYAFIQTIATSRPLDEDDSAAADVLRGYQERALAIIEGAYVEQMQRDRSKGGGAVEPVAHKRWPHFRIMDNSDAVAVSDRDTAYAHAKRASSHDCHVSWPICEANGWEPIAVINDVAIVHCGAGVYASVAPMAHHGELRRTKVDEGGER